MFHIDEAQAVRIKARIVAYLKNHFWQRSNWLIRENSAERIYDYNPPTTYSIYDSLEKFNISEAGFLFVLQKMRKMDTVRFANGPQDTPTAMNLILPNPKIVDLVDPSLEELHIFYTRDEIGRTNYRFEGNIWDKNYSVFAKECQVNDMEGAQ
jgi:hypothetical protein